MNTENQEETQDIAALVCALTAYHFITISVAFEVVSNVLELAGENAIHDTLNQDTPE